MDAPDLDKKRCPFCAEEIQAAAIVCRYCGRDVVDWKAPPAPVAPPPAKKKGTRWGCWVPVLLFLCGGVGLLSMVRVTPSERQSPAAAAAGCWWMPAVKSSKLWSRGKANKATDSQRTV